MSEPSSTTAGSGSGWHIVRCYLRRHALVYSCAVALVAAGSMLSVSIPWLLGRFADYLQRGPATMAEMAGMAGLIALVGLLRVCAGWSGRVLAHRQGRILAYELRRELFRKWGTLSPAYYHRHSTGDLLSHALSDVDVVRDLVSMGVNMSTTCLTMLAASLYMMAVHVDWSLTLAGLGPLVAIPVLVKFLAPKIRHQTLLSQDALGSMAQTVEESVGGMRAVKAFGNEQVMTGRFRRKVEDIFTQRMRGIRLAALFSGLVPLMANLGFVLVLGYGGYLVIAKEITLGDFVSVTLYLALLRMPLEALGMVLNVIQRASASLTRISGLLQAVSMVRDREGPLLDRPIRGEVRVQGLSFRYPGTERDVLTDISFTVSPGKTLGIIGPMGSGKTTLADLLLRLYDPPEGTVFVDGTDILRYPLARLREGVAYVPQEGFLFSATIMENIAFTDQEPDRERARQCADLAAVHDSIERFPEGFDMEIGERGARLSGGQKQRLAIARMMYKDAPLRILDDSLSAVDARTEALILKNLRGNGTTTLGNDGTTTIIVSHRLSAVRHADQILVLAEGRIRESGDHAALVASGGAYAALWRMQSGLTEDEAASLQTGLNQEGPSLPFALIEVVEAMEPGMMEGAA